MRQPRKAHGSEADVINAQSSFGEWFNSQIDKKPRRSIKDKPSSSRGNKATPIPIENDTLAIKDGVVDDSGLDSEVELADLNTKASRAVTKVTSTTLKLSKMKINIKKSSLSLAISQKLSGLIKAGNKLKSDLLRHTSSSSKSTASQLRLKIAEHKEFVGDAREIQRLAKPHTRTSMGD